MTGLRAGDRRAGDRSACCPGWFEIRGVVPIWNETGRSSGDRNGGCSIVAAAVIAGYAPACRASKINPTVALRHE